MFEIQELKCVYHTMQEKLNKYAYSCFCREVSEKIDATLMYVQLTYLSTRTGNLENSWPGCVQK